MRSKWWERKSHPVQAVIAPTGEPTPLTPSEVMRYLWIYRVRNTIGSDKHVPIGSLARAAGLGQMTVWWAIRQGHIGVKAATKLSWIIRAIEADKVHFASVGHKTGERFVLCEGPSPLRLPQKPKKRGRPANVVDVQVPQSEVRKSLHDQ